MADKIINHNWWLIFLFLVALSKFLNFKWSCRHKILIQRLKNLPISLVRLINFLQVEFECCLLSGFGWLNASSWDATWLNLILTLGAKVGLRDRLSGLKVRSQNLTLQMVYQNFLGLIWRALVADLVEGSNWGTGMILNFVSFILPEDWVKVSRRRSWHQVSL
jgi:hypothetical protein